MSKIKPATIHDGIVRASYSGNFVNKFNDIKVTPKINSLMKVNRNRIMLDREAVDMGRFRADNSSQRGYKTKVDVFDGNKPLFFRQSDFAQFRAGGFSQNSGAGKGGEFSVMEGKTQKYKPEFGIAGSGGKTIENPTGNPNPFAISDNRKVSKSKKKIKYVQSK